VAVQMFDDGVIQRRLNRNPLIRRIFGVIGRVKSFKEQARQFYFEVILSSYSCLVCGGRLHMTGTNECTCSCGKILDPTLTFQKSSCCGAKLVRRTFHYACSGCYKTVPSRFLFDEKIFDKQYFREMMRESRERSKGKKERLKRLLADSRSEVLDLTQTPDLNSVPGLVEDLNDFIGAKTTDIAQVDFDERPEFRMDDYRAHINSILGWDCILFSDIAALIDDIRNDKIWRFITLIYMQHEREVTLTQRENDILVKRMYHEAYA
jgi:hypothetical protein